jgi:hypothetical protein
LLVIAGFVLCSLGAGACNISGSSTPRATTSTTVLITTPSAQHEFNAAQRAWVNGSIAPSFQQSMYFSRAALLLSIAVTRGVSNVAQYNSSIGELKQLAALPETDDTSLQKSQARHDIRALDRFFSTTGLYQ